MGLLSVPLEISDGADAPQRRGALVVMDGNSPKWVEAQEKSKHRREFLRKIGYKLS
jgi:adenosine/AMP kinase